MKTKVVIDTNVLVSGIFFGGPPSRILKAWQDDKIQIAVSEEILEEYRRVIEELSARYGGLNADAILELLFRNRNWFHRIPLKNQSVKIRMMINSWPVPLHPGVNTLSAATSTC